MLIMFKDEKVAINPDRVDGVCEDWRNNVTAIYVGGALDPFHVKMDVETVVKILNREMSNEERKTKEE